MPHPLSTKGKAWALSFSNNNQQPHCEVPHKILFSYFFKFTLIKNK